MALRQEIHCEYWFQPWPFESPTFGFHIDFKSVPLPPSLVSFSAGCHTLNLVSLWPKSWWVASLFSGQLTSVHLWHIQKCSGMPTCTQTHRMSLSDLRLTVILHSTSPGWLLFCLSSKKKKKKNLSHSVIPPRLLPLGRKKLRLRVSGQVSPQPVLITT